MLGKRMSPVREAFKGLARGFEQGLKTCRKRSGYIVGSELISRWCKLGEERSGTCGRKKELRVIAARAGRAVAVGRAGLGRD